VRHPAVFLGPLLFFPCFFLFFPFPFVFTHDANERDEISKSQNARTSCQVVSWLKKPGDKVTKGEAVVVVESDKADMEVESFSTGTFAGQAVAEGGVASVGTPIAYIAETDADLEAAKAKAAGGGGGAAAPAPVRSFFVDFFF